MWCLGYSIASPQQLTRNGRDRGQKLLWRRQSLHREQAFSSLVQAAGTQGQLAQVSQHPQELARTQRRSLAPAGDLWLLRVNPEQVRSGTAFLTPCFPISTGPASISSRVWGSVLTCFYCLLIIVFSLKRNIYFFDKLKTSLCNKNAFRLSEQSLHLKNISGKDATVESSSHLSGQYLSINQEQQFLLKTQTGI